MSYSKIQHINMATVGLGILCLNFATGCSSPCDGDALSSATTGEAVLAACVIPEDLDSSWDCETPLPEKPTVASLQTLHKQCGLDPIGSADAFSTAIGNPKMAAALYKWMTQKGVVDAAKHAALVAGPAPFNGQPTFPAMPGVPSAEKLDVGITVSEDINAYGLHGAFPGWAVDGLSGGKTIYIADGLNLGTLRHALASVGKPGETVYLAGQGKTLTHFPLYVPNASEAETNLVLVETDGFTLDGKKVDPKSLSTATLWLPDNAPIGSLTNILGQWQHSKISIAMTHAPCGKGPKDMTCIPGAPGEATFYIDTSPAHKYEDCKKAGICLSARGTWRSAREVCNAQGKRLPHLWELQKAKVSGAISDINNQWTASWHGKSDSVAGPCEGAPRCRNADKRATSLGKGKSPGKKVKGSLHCASSNRWLATFPPNSIANPSPTPTFLANADLAKLANEAVEDNLADKGICGEDVRVNWSESHQKGGRSSTECRDPYSYVTSNEPRRHIWAPYFANLGGGYVGVGSDQSYDFIANARSDWAWVFDYDPNVVRLHKTLKILVEQSPTVDILLSRFSEEKEEETRKLILESKHFDEKTRDILERFYAGYRKKLGRHYRKSHKKPINEGFGWLATPENYAHIHQMYKNGHIVPVGADMLGAKALRSIGVQAQKMHIPIRIFYVSNAPTAWGSQVTPDWRKNILGLPFDEQSVVLTTFNWGGFEQTGYWHYNVMHGLLFQERMALPGYRSNGHDEGPAWDRLPGPDPDLTLSGLPGTGPF